MITLLDMKKAPQKLPEVKSMEYTVGSRSTQFHPEGLFSEVIFGPKDTSERKSQFGYIDIHCKILHPALVKAVGRLNSKIIHAIDKKAQYNFDEKDNLVEVQEDGEVNGITSVINNFVRIINARAENTQIRQDIRSMLLSYHKKDMVFIDKCIVIPPYWREAKLDVTGGNAGFVIPPVNDLYQKIIKLSIQIGSLSMEPGSIIYEIHAAKMQQLINELFDYLITRVSKKSGIVRQEILGKRLDFCGRAVIVGGSYDIKPNEIGVPFKMLVKLYEPFILYDMYNSGNVDKKKLEQLLMEYNNSTLSIVSLRSLFTDIQKGHVLSKEFTELIKESVNRVIADKILIGKRDPCLHAESIRGYKPVMVDGESIKLTPTACSGHNADFDGDQMALYTPLTRESIEEVKSKMCVPYSMDGMGKCADDLSKDFCIGLYNLTKNNLKFKDIKPRIVKSEKEMEQLHPNYPILVDGVATTVGRYKFNKIVPNKSYRTEIALTKKSINKLIQKAANEFYEKQPDVYATFVNNLVKLGGIYYTVMPATFCIEDLEIPKSILSLKDKLDTCKTDEEKQQVINKMEKLLKDYLEENQLNLGVIGLAGGLKGGYGQLRQILICKGIIQGAGGKVLSVSESYGSGMKSKDLFDTGYGARNGIADRVINTAPLGYLARKMAYAMQRVEGNYDMLDCGSRKTIQVKVNSDIAPKLIGRYVYNEENKLELFDPAKWMDKVIRLRTPIYCKTVRICRHCYGELLKRNRTANIGILAAQILGERVSQSSMKQFHVGGSVNIKIIDIRKELTTMMDAATRMMFDKQYRVDGSNLVCTNDGGTIVINSSTYDADEDFHVSKDKMEMTYGYFIIDCGSYKIDCTIDNKIEIPLANKVVNQTQTGYTIQFKPNDVVFKCIPTHDEFSKKGKMIEHVLSGKTPYKSPDHFTSKIYNIYKDMDCGADYVHYEVLVSNLLRDAGNPAYPARLNPKEYRPKIISLTAIPIQESWLQAFCFQNSKEAITNGLLYDRSEKETILEKLVTGNL